MQFTLDIKKQLKPVVMPSLNRAFFGPARVILFFTFLVLLGHVIMMQTDPAGLGLIDGTGFISHIRFV